jgi:hypothetical protein
VGGWCDAHACHGSWVARTRLGVWVVALRVWWWQRWRCSHTARGLAAGGGMVMPGCLAATCCCAAVACSRCGQASWRVCRMAGAFGGTHGVGETARSLPACLPKCSSRAQRAGLTGWCSKTVPLPPPLNGLPGPLGVFLIAVLCQKGWLVLQPPGHGRPAGTPFAATPSQGLCPLHSTHIHTSWFRLGNGAVCWCADPPQLPCLMLPFPEGKRPELPWPQR